MQRQQTSEFFVGRKKELDFFDQWLVDNNPEAPWLLYVHDAVEEQDKKGGIGKTRLLREFARRARVARRDLAIINVDFFNVADRDRLVIAERTVQSIKEAFPEWAAPAFTKALLEYRSGSYVSGLHPEKDVADVRIRDTFSEALATDFQELDNLLLAESGKTVLLFFDTFEMVESNPAIAVLGLMQTFPDNYRFNRVGAVIAGRNALDWNSTNWRGRESEVKVIPLTPFNNEEMLDFIREESFIDLPISAEEVQTLYELTIGRPILIGLVTDVLNYRAMTLQELLSVPYIQFEERLVTKVNDLEKPLNWVILFMAHVYHRFNIEILDWIASQSMLSVVANINYSLLIEKLPGLSFVRQPGRSQNFVLHDEMRRLVTRYCWEVQETNRDIRREISRCVVDYCDEQLKKDLREQDLQFHTIVKLYHMLFLDRDKGLEYFRERFLNAINTWRSAFARSLLQEVRPFAFELSTEQHYEMILAGAQLVRSEENPAEALRQHSRLADEASAEWYANNLEDILIEQGRCYLQLSRSQEAIDCFSRALELEMQRGEKAEPAYLLGLLGFIYRRRGELDVAMDYYQKCIPIHKAAGNEVAYADMLNNIGNVYRLRGKTEEALRACKIALQIRRRLFAKGDTGEVAVALSLSTIGMIYQDSEHLVLTERALLEAFEIYNRIGYKRGIAMGYNRLGIVQMSRGDLVKAQEFFKKAERASEDVDLEALINSLNKQGRVRLIQRDWESAAPLFRRAIEVAEQADSYQQVESLIDLATVLERQGQPEEAKPYWQQAHAISVEENYVLLLAQAEAAKGDISYDLADYATAFAHYGNYCRYAASYNTPEYNRSIRKISDSLLTAPPAAVPGILAQLIAFWTTNGLQEEYPEFISACEEMQAFMEI